MDPVDPPDSSVCLDAMTPPNLHVLLVEDDPQIVSQLEKALEQQGIEVDVARDGPSGFEAVSGTAYDVVVLDIGLPGYDGIEVLRRIRARGQMVPVLILTAQDDESDVVLGLQEGADDYMIKPASVVELIARLHAVHRRAGNAAEKTLRVADVELDTVRGVATRAGRRLRLTPTERDLLGVLMTSAPEVVAYRDILLAVWGIDFDTGTNVLPVHISRLRTKLEAGGQSRMVHTVRELGYRLG